MVNVIT